MGCGCHSLIIPPLRDMVHGAKEILKTRIGVGVSTTEEEKKRIEICRECEWATRNVNRLNLPSRGLTTLSQCQRCHGCFIIEKVKRRAERCPISKW